MIRVLVIAVALSLSACSWIEGDAGKARYRLEPVQDGNGELVCCAVDIENAKNIGKVWVSVEKGADGAYSITLEEDGVDAVGPMGAMVEQNGRLLDAVLKAVPMQ